jgi:hypothetical protein
VSPISFELRPSSLGAIRVGASRAEVHAAIGTPAEVVGRTERWFENALRIDFDEGQRAVFIEVHHDPPFEVRVGGHDPFAVAGEKLEDLFVPVFGPRVELEDGATWIFPASQVAVHEPFRPGAVSVARAGYHDDSVRGDVRELTVMAVICDAGEDDLLLMEAEHAASEVLARHALASSRDFGLVAAFDVAGQALGTLREVRRALPPSVRLTAGIDFGPTFVGTLVHSGRGAIVGPAADLAMRLVLVRPNDVCVTDAARHEATELGEAFEFPVRKPPRAKKGAPPAPIGRLARGYVVSSGGHE